MPHWKMDPQFAQTLLEAKRKGVKIIAYKAPLDIKKLEVRVETPVRVMLTS